MSDLGWLLDVHEPLILEGQEWRDRVEQLENLPRWFYTPSQRVIEFFAFLRGVGPKPSVIDDALWYEVWTHVATDLVAFVWHFCHHKNRDNRKLEIAQLQPGQIALVWRVAALVDSGLPVRIDILKERQGGLTWVITQIAAWVICFHENIGGLQAAHDEVTSRRIFIYLKEAYEWLPDAIRPKREFSNRKELVLREPKEELRRLGDRGLDSSIAVQTAKAEALGTGQPIQLFHASEIGKWEGDPETTYTSAVNAIQLEPMTFIFRESTARGHGSFWHVEWKASLNIGREGWNGHTPVFLPWYLDKRNRKVCPPGIQWGTSDDHEFGNEEQLGRLYRLDDEQLWWRRLTIQKQAQGTGVHNRIDLFRQEHPSTQEEAWLHAHGRWLEPSFVGELTERCENEEKAGELTTLFVGDLQPHREEGIDMQPVARGSKGNIWLQRLARGPLTIFRWPDPRFDYIVGGDLSEGIEGGDCSCAKVYQRVGREVEGGKKNRMVAEWYGLCDPDAFADILWWLGWFYSCGTGTQRIPALLAWEKSGPGRGVAKWLRTGSHPYPASRMYRKHNAQEQKFRQDHDYGVATTAQSKPLLLAAWRQAAREGDVQLTIDDIQEVASLTKNERGMVDTNGADRFMASAMAMYASMFTLPLWGKEDVKEEEPPPNTVKWALRMNERQRKQPKSRTILKEM